MSEKNINHRQIEIKFDGETIFSLELVESDGYSKPSPYPFDLHKLTEAIQKESNKEGLAEAVKNQFSHAVP